MSLRTVFIGIDKHQDSSIRELVAARRDATALWSGRRIGGPKVWAGMP